jgi:hypothetical protein
MTRGGGTHEEASVRTTLEGKPVRQDGGAGGAARIHIFVALTRPNRFRERVSWDSTAGAVPHFGVWEGSAGATTKHLVVYDGQFSSRIIKISS